MSDTSTPQTEPKKLDNTTVHVEMLDAQGLCLLATALDSSSAVEAERIVEMILEKTQIDVSDSNILVALTKEQIEQLKDFEYDNSRLLLNVILNSKDSSVKDAKTYESAETLYNKSIAGRNKISRLMGVAFGVFAMLYIIAITWLAIPEENMRFADTVLGFVLGTVFNSTINYFFGIPQNDKHNEYKNEKNDHDADDE